MSKSSVSPISLSSHMSKSDSEYHLQGLKAIAEDLIEDKPKIVFDAACIRKKSNWSSLQNYHKFDDIFFDPERFIEDIPSYSPKLHSLLKKIDALDSRDERKYGRKFKHFIFSDIKPFAKLLASALIATDWKLGYHSELTNREDIIRAVDREEKRPNAKWTPLEMLPNSDLKKGKSFYLLSSVGVFEKSISVRLKKEILSRFNERPDNVYGDNVRIIIMDSGFKEGIDLFDIKYVHIFEPSLNSADQKQVIGRGTRTCGQKGLEFHPTKGWPLEVYLYDLEIPAPLRASLLGSETAQELLMKAMNVDVRLANFGYDIERLSVIGSVDYELNKAVHSFNVDLEADEEEIVLGGAQAGEAQAGEAQAGEAQAGGMKVGGAHRKFGEKKGDMLHRHHERFGHKEMVQYVKENYGQYKWQDVKMENLCVEKGGKVNEWDLYHGGASTIINFTPTQDFVRNYFKPSAPIKGMLLHHSVGTGKTASAIAAATANFEPAGYTILWVTRTTLKNDIWKNMFDQVANESIRNLIAAGENIPNDQKERMKLLSKAWRIRPISYKQFSNLVSKQNSYYQRLVKENGEADPLRKTLLIIDEAHKLYGGGDLSSLERPDMEALHKSLMTSYAVSGEDSVRLLLMTATPITENPMEIVKLVNLCKTVENQMPTSFEVFSQKYLDEDGKFSTKGEHQFLDDIAGHISYLNREKDARQFSQPILRRVMVPIVTESQMKDVRDFDRFVARSDTEAEVIRLNTEVEKIAEKLDGELAELDKTRFQHLKKACEYHEEIPKKKCEAVVNRNIGYLVKEVKDHVKGLRAESKKIRLDIKTANSGKKNVLQIIKNKILKYPASFDKYKKSTYAALRNACSTTIKTSSQFLDAVKDIPEVQELNRKIADYKEEIDAIEKQQAASKDVLKLKIKRAKEMLRDPELAPLEQSVLELTIRAYQKERRKTAKNKDTISKVEDLKKDINTVEQEKKKVFSNIRKSIKKMVKDRKTREKESKKELRNLRKTMRKQGKLEDEIDSDEIKDMVARREILIERDLEEIGEEAREKEIEKLRKQKAKEEEREEKAREKEFEKVKAAREKELEKERVAREKQAAKVKVAREKELEKEKVAKEKQAAKEKAAKEKQAEKEKEKLDKKREQDAAKTKKVKDRKDLQAKEKAQAKTRKNQEKKAEKKSKK